MQPYPKYNLDLARIADSVMREVNFQVQKIHTTEPSSKKLKQELSLRPAGEALTRVFSGLHEQEVQLRTYNVFFFI